MDKNKATKPTPKVNTRDALKGQNIAAIFERFVSKELWEYGTIDSKKVSAMCCPFHNDGKPSAYMFFNSDTGMVTFRCTSSSCSHPVETDLFKVIVAIRERKGQTDLLSVEHLLDACTKDGLIKPQKGHTTGVYLEVLKANLREEAAAKKATKLLEVYLNILLIETLEDVTKSAKLRSYLEEKRGINIDKFISFIKKDRVMGIMADASTIRARMERAACGREQIDAVSGFLASIDWAKIYSQSREHAILFYGHDAERTLVSIQRYNLPTEEFPVAEKTVIVVNPTSYTKKGGFGAYQILDNIEKVTSIYVGEGAFDTLHVLMDNMDKEPTDKNYVLTTFGTNDSEAIVLKNLVDRVASIKDVPISLRLIPDAPWKSGFGWLLSLYTEKIQNNRVSELSRLFNDGFVKIFNWEKYKEEAPAEVSDLGDICHLDPRWQRIFSDYTAYFEPEVQGLASIIAYTASTATASMYSGKKKIDENDYKLTLIQKVKDLMEKLVLPMKRKREVLDKLTSTLEIDSLEELLLSHGSPLRDIIDHITNALFQDKLNLLYKEINNKGDTLIHVAINGSSQQVFQLPLKKKADYASTLLCHLRANLITWFAASYHMHPSILKAAKLVKDEKGAEEFSLLKELADPTVTDKLLVFLDGITYNYLAERVATLPIRNVRHVIKEGVHFIDNKLYLVFGDTNYVGTYTLNKDFVADWKFTKLDSPFIPENKIAIDTSAITHPIEFFQDPSALYKEVNLVNVYKKVLKMLDGWTFRVNTGKFENDLVVKRFLAAYLITAAYIQPSVGVPALLYITGEKSSGKSTLSRFFGNATSNKHSFSISLTYKSFTSANATVASFFRGLDCTSIPFVLDEAESMNVAGSAYHQIMEGVLMQVSTSEVGAEVQRTVDGVSKTFTVNSPGMVLSIAQLSNMTKLSRFIEIATQKEQGRRISPVKKIQQWCSTEDMDTLRKDVFLGTIRIIPILRELATSVQDTIVKMDEFNIEDRLVQQITTVFSFIKYLMLQDPNLFGGLTFENIIKEFLGYYQPTLMRIYEVDTSTDLFHKLLYAPIFAGVVSDSAKSNLIGHIELKDFDGLNKHGRNIGITLLREGNLNYYVIERNKLLSTLRANKITGMFQTAEGESGENIDVLLRIGESFSEKDVDVKQKFKDVVGIYRRLKEKAGIYETFAKTERYLFIDANAIHYADTLKVTTKEDATLREVTQGDTPVKEGTK